jgi:phosphatidylglycerophosphate synthase
LERPKDKSFIFWNASNFFTLSRAPIPVILFLTKYSIEAKLISSLILYVVTDVLDGIFARKSGNDSDIGKILDPLVDKPAHISLPVFLFLNRIVEEKISTMVVVGELFVLSLPIICSIMFLFREIFYRKNLSPREIYRKSKKELVENIDVHTFGKCKMVAYSVATAMASINHIYPYETLHFMYQAIFYLGVLFCAISCFFYVSNFMKWVNRFLDQD